MNYKCVNCKKEITLDLNKDKKIICPFCGYRIIEKLRPQKSKRVDAI